MRAAIVSEPGAPFAVGELRKPEPQVGEILIKVAGCGVCHSDLHVRGGGIPFPMPCVLGHEVSGVIETVGGGVDRFAVGDRIVGAFIMPCGRCAFCRSGQEDLCENFFAQNRLRGTLYDGHSRLRRPDGTEIAMYSMGGMAQYAVMPVGAAAVLPDALPLSASAVLGCAFLTAYGAAHHTAMIQPTETAVVVGAGGVGLALVQVLRALGCATIVAVDISASKRERAIALGASHAVDATDATAASAAVREATAGQGADVVFEAVGLPQTFRLATELVADGGRCTMVGLGSVGDLGSVEINRLVRRKLRILGSFGGRPSVDLPAVIALAVQGKLDVDAAVTDVYRLDDVQDAYAALERGEILGRAIVEMDTTISSGSHRHD